MLRITQVNSRDSVTLKLEGRVVGPWVGELADAIAGARHSRGSLRLDMAKVLFIDAAGALLIRSLIREGVAIASCSNFIAELLHVENP